MSEEKTEQQKCAEALARYFEESDEVKAAHLLYKDPRTLRPDINKFQFYLIAMTARNGHDGKDANGDLGWAIKLKEQPETAVSKE
jgi:hypothetical protein